MRVRLREVRERQLMTQAELAQRSGVTEAAISRIESGKQRPRISTVRKLAEALAVPPEELVVWEADEEPADTGKAVPAAA